MNTTNTETAANVTLTSEEISFAREFIRMALADGCSRDEAVSVAMRGVTVLRVERGLGRELSASEMRCVSYTVAS